MNSKLKNYMLIGVPGLISFYRHAYKFTIINNILPILLVELTPFIALAIIDSGNIFFSIYSYFLLCIFYEIGYVVNDNVKTQSEEINTIRNSIDPQYLVAFITFRAAIVILILIFTFVYFKEYFIHYLIFSTILSTVFFLHNSFKTTKCQIFTFTLLNVLKLAFRTFNVGSMSMFLLAASPYIFLKLLHYLNHKRAISFKKLQFNDHVTPVYSAFFIILAYVNIDYLPITALYLVNHKKREWLNILK
jgi:hypothetical protein